MIPVSAKAAGPPASRPPRAASLSWLLMFALFAAWPARPAAAMALPAGVTATATTASASAKPAQPPLRRNGLLAWLLQQVRDWLHGVAGQWHELERAWPALAAAFGPAANPPGWRLLERVALALAGLFAGGLAAEWLAYRLLAGPRRILLASLDATDAGARGDMPARHAGRLHGLAPALGLVLLDLLPLLAFLFVAGLLLALAGDDEPRVRAMAVAFVVAYAATRVTLAVVGRLLLPTRAARGRAGAILHAWLRWIVALLAFGIALGNALPWLGAAAARIAVLKLVALLAGLAIVALAFRLRPMLAPLIEPPAGAVGAVAALRRWFAAWWALLASLLAIGLWIVLPLGLRDGLATLLRFAAATGLVLVAARLVATLLLGLAAHALCGSGQGTPDDPSRGRRRYLLVRRLLLAVVALATLPLLLQAWGVDAIGWLARNPVGRGLVHAVATIAVTLFAAILAWEAAVRALERRIARWTDQGERLRAARLRTLLPMIRTALTVVVVLTVGLTGLGELGVNTASLIASAGIVGIAVGFGSQKLVQDFVTGLFLLLENTMQVGDSVTVASVSGTVEDLSVRTVRLRGGDGSLYTVPFSAVTTVNNQNRGQGNAGISVDIAADADINAALDALREIGHGIRQDPAYAPATLGDVEVWGVNAMDGSRITLLGQIRCTDAGRWGVQREMNRRIVRRFRELGIALADPNRRSVRLIGSADDAHATTERKGAP